MSFLIYQRSDPRYPDWLPLITQQLRLRNLIQVIGINLNTKENEQLYYTLHLPAMSAPFFTSENVSGGSIVSWREIEPRQMSNVKLSAAGLVIRIWSSQDGSKPIVSWGIHFKGLHFLGVKGDWNSQNFHPKTILIRMPFGFFTAVGCVRNLTESPKRFVCIEKPIGVCRDSYIVKTLTGLHRIQRSLLEELELARRLRFQIGIYGFSSECEHSTSHTLSSTTVTTTTTASLSSSPPLSSTSSSSIPITSNLSSNVFSLPRSTSTSITKSISHFPSSSYNLQLVVSGRALLRVQQEKTKLKWKEEIESMKLLVSLLKDEKGRAEGRVHRLKKKTVAMEDLAGDLIGRVHALGRERERLRDYKNLVADKKQKLVEKQAALSLRKKQLISELLVIYPLQLVEGSKRYSISEIQLPNAEDYGNESGAQISVALGYTAHFVAMLASLLGIPLRYPIRHFGSHSRIIDHITTQIPTKEREFPLYFRGREDVYSKYAVYLLNKNIAQIRWYCGLATTDLRATLPNLFNCLTSRLIIPGWPPCPGDSCEIAEELTEQNQHLCRTELSLSLDGGLDQIESMSSQPKTFEDLRMQSWLRSSWSDLEAVNSVPDGDIQHGKAQNRFLSGWKKKTYSESEDIDPRWLTNSLNLEYDIGHRRPSITASPPLRVPSILITQDAKEILRKRRYGRIESSQNLLHQQQQNICDISNNASPTSNSNLLASSSEKEQQSNITPNRRILEVEKQINEFERRKSICDITGHGSPTHLLHHSSLINSFALSSSTSSTTHTYTNTNSNGNTDSNTTINTTTPSSSSETTAATTTTTSTTNATDLQLPVVEDAWPTTDEEKLDSIADIVRKISLMEMQLNRAPADQQFSTPIPSPNPIQILSTVTEIHEQSPSQDEHEYELEDKNPNQHEQGHHQTENEQEENENQSKFSDKSEEVQIGDNIDIFLRSTETEDGDHNEQQQQLTCGGDREKVKSAFLVPDNVHNSDNNNHAMTFSSTSTIDENLSKHLPELNCDKTDNSVQKQTTGKIQDEQKEGEEENNHVEHVNDSTENFNNSILNNSITNNGDDSDDPSSLWFRTENLLSTTSFNLVKRRVSES